MSRINKPAYPIRGRIFCPPLDSFPSARQKLRGSLGLAAPSSHTQQRVSHSWTWACTRRYLQDVPQKYGVTSRWAQSALPKCAIASLRLHGPITGTGGTSSSSRDLAKGPGRAQKTTWRAIVYGGGCHKPCQGSILAIRRRVPALEVLVPLNLQCCIHVI